MKKPKRNKIAAGLEDAIAFAKGDKTRGRVTVVKRRKPPKPVMAWGILWCDKDIRAETFAAENDASDECGECERVIRVQIAEVGTAPLDPDTANVLKACKRRLRAERELIVESSTLQDENGQPRLETLDAAPAADVRAIERLIARIDKLRGQGRK